MLGTLYIISAPSGAGKTSLVKAVSESTKDITVSVSHTTRKKRPKEINEVNYYFISLLEFNDMIEKNQFLEHAFVFNNYYGTSKRKVQENLKKGIDVILEIDHQGATQIKKSFPSAKTIFIFPPSKEVLQQRLINRGEDSHKTIEHRMNQAIHEIKQYNKFDYLIVNDVFTHAVSQIKSIIQSNRLQKAYQEKELQSLIKQLIN